MKDRPHDEVMVELFRSDLAYAVELLADVRRNGDSNELLVILRQMKKAFGQNWSDVSPI